MNFLIPNHQKLTDFQYWKQSNRRKTSLTQLPIEPSKLNLTVLPQDFAKQIFFYELQVQSDEINLTDVKKLLELYRIGTEYYEQESNDKYLIFKNKSQSLLIKKEVQNILESQVQIDNSLSQQTQKYAVKLDEKNKENYDQNGENQILTNHNQQNNQESKQNVFVPVINKQLRIQHENQVKFIEELNNNNRIFDDFMKEQIAHQEKVSNILKQDIQSQEDQMKIRIDLRKKCSLRKSLKI